ncbi:stage III sporulation protein AB [Microaerobacter geothermalis]|uniref:stage III sporulation protein SpoIIIAB n=1 Tax=Microaerobacter geothermalis TaxID=674972 RepID=UPI001F3E941E|nr:stage III sporulation protein SpoIIIAB [Microaerobacter geothermalis]MCF6094456.1 stage III sporulation protein AB [Microaerobacter geothermalis]
MMKILGASIVVFATTYFGFYLAKTYAERPNQIRNLRSALKMLETEVVYGATPINEAFRHIGKRIKEPVSSLFIQTAKRLENGDGLSFIECWKYSLNEEWRNTFLKKSEYEILLQLGHVIGLSGKADQVKHIHLALANLEVEELQAKEDHEKYAKVSKSLGVLSGILIVILML